MSGFKIYLFISPKTKNYFLDVKFS